VDVNIKKNSTAFPETRKTIKKEFLIPFRNHLMNRPIRILAVAGSLREGSYSTLAAKMALNLSKNYGALLHKLLSYLSGFVDQATFS
jgi:hypothetical protein